MRRAALLAFAAIAAVATPFAQAPAATSTVLLDVVATDASGRPIGDLGAEDLRLRLDGRTLVPTRVRPPRPRTSAAPSPFPAPYASNDGASGRTILVLVDGTRLLATRLNSIRDGLTDLTAQLGPSDRIGLVPMGTTAKPVDFTTDHTRIVEAASALPLGAARTPEDQDDAIEAVLGAAGRAAATIGDGSGSATLILVTEPFAPSSQVRRAIESLSRVLAERRVALSVAAPGFTSMPSAGGMHALAAATGGTVLTASWSTVVADDAARYEVEVPAHESWKPLEVIRAMASTTRPGIVVRSNGYALVRPADPTALQSLTDMLRQSRQFTGLPLRLAAFPVLHTDRESVRLLIVGETVEPPSRLAWAEFALVTPEGRVVSQWKEDKSALSERPLVAGVVAPEGTYRLRWAASELAGRRGTVDLDVDARLTPAGAFRLSGLMLGQLDRDTFVPLLQPPSTATTIEWYAEVYGALPAGTTLAARVDIVSSPGEAPRLTEQGRVLTSPDAERRAMTGRVSVETLPPGDYQVRATLVVDGKDAGTVAQTFRKRQ